VGACGIARRKCRRSWRAAGRPLGGLASLGGTLGWLGRKERSLCGVVVAVPNSLRVRKCKRRAMGRGHTERLAVIKQEERDEWEDGQPDTDKKDDAAFDCTGCQVDNDRALAGRTERITAAGASHRSALMVHVLLSHSMQSAATRGLCAVASEIRQSAAGQRQHLCPLSPMMTLAGLAGEAASKQA
jgi:hypothetical protein